MASTQTSLFARHHLLPKGFDHKDEVLSPNRECVLVGQFAQLPFKEFEFQGFLGRRRVVSFGWRYDFSRRELRKADEIPDFLLHLRVTATEFVGLDASRFQQVLVTEYSPGAGIGWHKDRPEFEHVIGFPCFLHVCFDFVGRGAMVGNERQSTFSLVQHTC